MGLDLFSVKDNLSHRAPELQRTEEVDFLQNLVVGMPARMQEVIDRDGGMTKY